MKCTLPKHHKKNELKTKTKMIKTPILFPVIVIFLAVVLIVTITGITDSKVVFPQEDNTNTTILRDNFSKNFDGSSTMQNATLSAFAQENTMLPPMQPQTPPQLKNDSSSAIVDNETANSNNDEVVTEKQSSTETLTQNMELLQFEIEPDDDNYLEDLEESDNYP